MATAEPVYYITVTTADEILEPDPDDIVIFPDRR
jgi:hypothetical protein